MDEKVHAVIGKLLADSTDDDGRWDRDYALIRANAEMFNETIVLSLFSGAEQSLSTEGIQELREHGFGDMAPHVALEHAERMYELAQRISRVTEHCELEARAAHLMAGVAEKRGRVIRAAEGYEIVRDVAKKTNDQSNYLLATFNQARAYMMYPGLDHQAIPLLEEAMTLAEAHGNEEVLTRGCNFLIHLYEKRNESTAVERVRAILRQAMTR